MMIRSSANKESAVTISSREVVIHKAKNPMANCQDA